MSDEAVKKYNIVSQNFKAQSEGLLKDVVGGISQVIDGSRQNYMDLQKGYLKGYTDMIQQSKSANAEMLGTMAKNFSDLKVNVNSMHQQLKTNLADAYNKSVNQFTAQCEEIVKKFPFLPKEVFVKAVAELKANYTKIVDGFEKRHTANLADLEKKYSALVKELSIPDVKPPTLIQLSSKAVESTQSSAQPAQPKPGPSPKKK